MTLTLRTCQGEEAAPLIVDLLRTLPASTRHLVDFPWRLSSTALQSGHDACILEQADGTLVGFAAWQVYWAALDFFVRPGPHRSMVETAIFAWATQRFRDLDQERGKPLPYWVEFRNDDTERRLLVENQGFLLDEEYHYVQFHHSLSAPLADPALPDSFLLRQLKGEQEVNAYTELHRAAFASTSMTPDWRARTLRMPRYRPELDLVVVAPDGSLAGFCIGWLDQERHLGQIEPLGVHPRFHRMGLGRALLLEMLRRFKIYGATSVLVETESTRFVAQRAYESAGFRPLHTVLLKGKWVSATSL